MISPLPLAGEGGRRPGEGKEAFLLRGFVSSRERQTPAAFGGTPFQKGGSTPRSPRLRARISLRSLRLAFLLRHFSPRKDAGGDTIPE
jgi:hypothetical protein